MNLFELATRGVDLDALPAGRSPERESAVSAPVEFAVPQDLNAAFDAAADEYGVDADVLRAMAYAESRFRPDVMAGQVKSRTGATGLMQFMPETAKRFGIDPTDPVESIFGAAAYMRANLEKFDGDYDKAVAAYNWGENRQAYGRPDWKDQLPQETRGYLGTVFSVADGLKAKAPAQESAAKPLPDEVKPSGAGAGRGVVSPGMVNTKLSRAAVPDMTAGSVAQDIAAGALKVGPTFLKGVGEVASLVTGGHVGQEFANDMQKRMGVIDDMVGSDRAQAQRQNFAADMADDSVSISDALLNNKGAMADMALPQLGSMLLPVGVAGAAGKAAKVGAAAQAMDTAALAARVASVQKAAGVGAVAAQNAASTFAELVNKGASLPDAYTAAGITVPFSLVAGKLTGGGAEGALIRSTLGDVVKKGAVQVPLAMLREGGQEIGEEAGQVVGEAVGTGQTPSLRNVGKQLAVAGAMGGLMGGGMDVATQAMAPTVESQPKTPTVPPVAPSPVAPPVQPQAPAADDLPAQILQAEQTKDTEALPTVEQRDTGTVMLRGGDVAAVSQQLQDAGIEHARIPGGILVGATGAQAAAQMFAPPTETQPNAPTPANPGEETTPAPSAQGAPEAAVVLQNRNRSTPASVAQMRSIAANPDYGRLGFSRDFANGAPVVAGGAIPAAQLGRQDTATASNGRRIPVQYAVVDAADVLTSNRVDGSPNVEYGNEQVQAVRAVAGNGRIAGLQAAYQANQAAQYTQELAQDSALHGVDPRVIAAMKNPVLVRVMPQSEITADIGDLSNTTGGLSLSAVEQANNDANRVDLAELQFSEDGSLTTEAVRQFVRAMPQAEQGGLIDTTGQPSKQAIDRLQAAVFAKAYGNEQLIRLFAQAQDPEARNILSALSQVANKMARLEGAGALDIRDVVAQAAEIAVNAKREGKAMAIAAQQMDMAADPDVSVVLDLFASNMRRVKAIVEALGNAADFAYTEANKPDADMFGEVPRASRTDILNTLRPLNERTSQADMEQPAGSGAVQGDAIGQGADTGAAPDPEPAQAGRPAEDAGQAQGRTGPTSVNEPAGEFNVRQQFSLFGQEEGDQLQLFLDNGPVPSQAGAGAVAAQREAVAAIADMESVASILAKSLSRDFAARQKVRLVGHTVSSAADLALLAQVYRDPRFETFRLVFTDNSGRVVSQLGITSRLPASATVIVGDDMAAYLREVSNAAKKTGATSYYMLHNHPSGQATPSGADLQLTKTFARWLPGMTLRSHVVIDTNQYSVIDANGKPQFFQQDFAQPPQVLTGPLAGEVIASPSDVVRMAQSLQTDAGAITLIATDAQFKVKAVSSIPAATLSGSKGLVRLKIARALMRLHSANVFAVGRDVAGLRKLGGIVVDALHVKDDGSVDSLASAGVIASKNLGAFPEDRRARVTPDTTENFAYLRFDPSAMQSAGQKMLVRETMDLFGDAQEDATQQTNKQSAKAKTASERAADVADARDDERKRIAQASVRAAAEFELGQDPLDSLTGQEGLKFSRGPATEVRNLVTLHNLTEDNLRYADSLGGIPVPSIGITKVDSPFGGFGNITLIASKDMIDPKAGVPVYDRDAWTARFPTMNFKKVKAKLADAFYDRVKPVREMMAGDDGGFVSALWEQVRNASVQSPEKVIDIFTRYEAGRVLYAKEVLGKSIKVPMRNVRPSMPSGHDAQLVAYWKTHGAALMRSEHELSGAEFANTPENKAFEEEVRASIRRYAEAVGEPEKADSYISTAMPDGTLGAGLRDRWIRDIKTAGTKEIDRTKLAEAVDKAVKRNDPDYLRWVESLVKPLFEAPTITLRGKEVPATLDNIVDAMTVGATAGVEKSMTFSAGKAAAMLGKRFKSMDEIKAARDQVVSPQAEADGKKSSDALLEAYRSHVSQFYTGKDWRGNIDTWAANDDAMEALAKAGTAASSDANIRAALTRMGFKGVDQQALDMARDAIDALRNAATDYFEAKPQRAVGLSEFKGAVVPKGTSPEAIAILEKHGIAVELYGKTEGAREKAIQKLAKRLDKENGGVLFSRAQPAIRSAAAAMEEARRMADALYDAEPGAVTMEEFSAVGDARRAAEAAMLDALAQLPDSGFAVEARTSDGRMLIVTPSASEQGRWQLTRFGKDGEPSGDTRFDTKRQALQYLVDEAVPSSIKPAGAAMSRANQPLRTPAATIRAAITKAYGKLLGQLESKGLVTLTQTQEQAIEAAAQARADKTGQPLAEVRASLMGSVSNSVATDDLDIRRSANGAIQGFFDPQTGQPFLIADNLTAEAAPGVFMHEVGIHMANDGTLQPLFDRASAMVTEPTDPFLQRVKDRMDAAGETSGEEAAAYIVEAYENDRENAPSSVVQWVKDFIADVRAWLFSKGVLVKADQLTVADIAAIARANARTLANGVPVDAGSNGTRKGGGLLYSIQRDKQGMPVIEGDGVTLQYGQPTDRLEFIPTDDSHQMLRFAVSTDANPFAGYVDALFQDGKPVALYDIFMEPDQRKGGSATKAVKALLDASPDGKLDISNIVTEAQEFWAKMGIPTQPNQPKGYAYDGTITQESFAASDAGKNAGTTRSDLPRGSGVRQAQDGRGRAGRSEESRAGTDGIEVSELTWEQAQAQGLKFSKKQAQQQALDLATPQWQLPDATKTDRLIYELQDGRIDLKRAQEAIAKAGRTITEGFDARLAETLMPGRVAYRTETFLKVEVQPLLEAMARNKVSQDELSDYLLARHAPERNAQISKINPDMPDGGAGTNSQGVLMTTQAARDHIAGLTSGKRTALELLARQVDALTQGTREMLVREGLEKQETIDAWTGAYQHYVPLFKDEAMETPGHPIGSGFSVTGSASKRSTGSSGEVTNMVAHILMQREAAITRAEKNRVAMSLYGLALTHPNAQMWTTVRPSMSDAQIEAELQRMGVDPVEAQSGMQGAPTIRAVDPVTGLVVDRPNPLYKRMDNALVVKVNGEDRVILFNKANPRALRMVQNLKNQDGVIGLDMAGSVVGRATRYLAAINTQYNPAFGMVNIVRDLGGAMVNLTDTPLAGKQARVLGDSIAAMQGIARDLRGDSKRTPWSDLWKQFQEDGGRTGYRDLFIDPYKRAESVQGDLDKLSKAGKLTPGAAAHAVLDLLDDFNTTLENGVRLSAYKAALDMGMSRSAAARVARELTLDFNRKGRTGRELGPLYAFFNASIQGTARTVQALKGPAGKRILAGGLSLGVVQALMLAAAGFDDDEIPEFIKARAFIIPMPGKQYIAIPLQFGLNALPNTGRVVTELLMSGGREWQEKTFDAVGELAGSFNPMGGGNIFTASGALKTIAPTVLDPLIEMGTNTGFSGQPIAKERMPWDTRPGFTMGRESTQRAVTGQVYVGISQAINRLTFGDDYTRGLASPAPEHVRYVFTTVGGGVFRELEKALSAAVLTAKGEDLKAREVPLGSRFAGEVDDEQVQRSRYYKNHARMEKLEAKLKGLAKDGKGEELRQFVLDEPAVKLYEANNQVAGELARLNKLAVENITDKEALKRIDAARTNTMRVLNDKVREMEKR